MVYGLLADVVMVTHFAFIVFLPVGALLTWRWPRLVWVHLPTAVYGLVIITVGFTCPLTPLERSLRARAGERAFTGGFVDHYIEGALYLQRYAGLIRGLVAHGRRLRRAGRTAAPTGARASTRSCTPPRTASTAMTSAATGSAHHHPSARCGPSPASAARQNSAYSPVLSASEYSVVLDRVNRVRKVVAGRGYGVL